jgi:Phage portal protein
MGFRQIFLSGTPSTPVPINEPPEFGAYGSPAVPGVGADPFSLQTLSKLFNGGAPVSRAEALHCSSVQRVRNLICDLPSLLPLHCHNKNGEKEDRALISQPEAGFGFTASYSLSMLLDDLFFFAESLWVVDVRGWDSFPLAVRRVPMGRWVIEEDGTIRVGGKRMNSLDCILFRSSRDGFLSTASGTIRALQALEAVAAQNLNVPSAREFFRSKSGKKYTNEQIDAFLATADAARRKSRSGWLPPDVERIEVTQPTAQEQRLIDQRNFGVLEIARHSGVHASWLSVPTADKTYQNAQDENRRFVEQVAMPYLKAIEDRLSLGDCVPRGHKVRWNMNSILRAQPLERMKTYQLGLEVGAYTKPEIRELEDKPPLSGGESDD